MGGLFTGNDGITMNDSATMNDGRYFYEGEMAGYGQLFVVVVKDVLHEGWFKNGKCCWTVRILDLVVGL